MTTVEALKELFTALGGSEEDVKAITTNPEMVHAIAEVASGAIELPKVTAADAGDILAVDESGKWAKTAPESGLPEVSAEDNGDVLAVVEGAWAKKTPETPSMDYVTINNNITAEQLVNIIDNEIPAKVEISNSKYAPVCLYDHGSGTRFLCALYGVIDANNGTISLTAVTYKMLTSSNYTKYTSTKTIS